jgi:hypothetical protein
LERTQPIHARLARQYPLSRQKFTAGGNTICQLQLRIFSLTTAQFVLTKRNGEENVGPGTKLRLCCWQLRHGLTDSEVFSVIQLPICWSKSQPGDEGLPKQPEPQDEVSHQEKGDRNEKPRNEREKANNERLSHVVCIFPDWAMIWSASILLISL